MKKQKQNKKTHDFNPQILLQIISYKLKRDN